MSNNTSSGASATNNSFDDFVTGETATSSSLSSTSSLSSSSLSSSLSSSCNTIATVYPSLKGSKRKITMKNPRIEVGLVRYNLYKQRKLITDLKTNLEDLMSDCDDVIEKINVVIGDTLRFQAPSNNRYTKYVSDQFHQIHSDSLQIDNTMGKVLSAITLMKKLIVDDERDTITNSKFRATEEEKISNVFRDLFTLNFDCPICLEVYNIEDVTFTPCSHVMCITCIMNLHVNFCPICKTKIHAAIRYKKVGCNCCYQLVPVAATTAYKFALENFQSNHSPLFGNLDVVRKLYDCYKDRDNVQHIYANSSSEEESPSPNYTRDVRVYSRRRSRENALESEVMQIDEPQQNNVENRQNLDLTMTTTTTTTTSDNVSDNYVPNIPDNYVPNISDNNNSISTTIPDNSVSNVQISPEINVPEPEIELEIENTSMEPYFFTPIIESPLPLPLPQSSVSSASSLSRSMESPMLQHSPIVMTTRPPLPVRGATSSAINIPRNRAINYRNRCVRRVPPLSPPPPPPPPPRLLNKNNTPEQRAEYIRCYQRYREWQYWYMNNWSYIRRSFE